MKPASLSSALLAPKGGAAPTDRAVAPAMIRPAPLRGWKTAAPMRDQPPPRPAAAQSAAGVEGARKASPVAAPAAGPVRPGRDDRGRDDRGRDDRGRDDHGRDDHAAAAAHRVNLSFRLDNDRHLRLKLAAAHLRMSAQEILVSALDQFLERLTPAEIGTRCACLARPRAECLRASRPDGGTEGSTGGADSPTADRSGSSPTIHHLPRLPR
jgi:hypothetical protein